MRALQFLTVFGLAALAAIPASADIFDPLHGYCSVGCIDNGTNSPTTQNPITGFGFTISPGPNTGDLLIEVLVPDNKQTAPNYAITGTSTKTATLFSATDWTSGQLDTYLGLSAAPTNAIGAYLPSTQALDPGATGFSVYQADLGTMTLQDASNPNVFPLLNISALPAGSYIVGFFTPTTGGGIVATANSGAIFETRDAVTTMPEPSSVMLFGSILVGVAEILRRRVQRKA